MAKDPELLAHQEWLGYLQPVGLVVSPPALAAAQAFPARNVIAEHNRFLEIAEPVHVDGQADPQPAIRDFPRFATQILGWEAADLAGAEGGGALPESLEVALPEYHETLRPSYAVPEFDKTPDGDRRWLMLIQRVTAGLDLDETPEAEAKDHRWQASPQARFERLLRETQVPIGLLSNATHLRLVYAPRGETSGHLTFPVKAMTEVAGRPIFAALLMLLSAERLFTLPDKQRLPYILAESRKYQNLVSTKLAEQVLAALYELLRGFQAADDQRHGNLLRAVLQDDPNHVYAGLLTVLLRLVFLLYAEDRSLLSNDEVYQKYYAVTGLFERLREDAGRHTDTMDHRYGAWAQLLTLFRLIYDGGRHGGLRLPARKGYLFDPDRYAFLEGRQKDTKRQPGERTDPPHISDGVVFRVLQNLVILDGERLSYRTLDVEQIGSVYETMMGFDLEVAKGRSIAIKPKKPHGAPTTIDLEELLAEKPAERAKWLKARADQEITGQAAAALKEARTPEDAVVALEKKVARAATPRIVPPAAMVLQPSDERRKSGSHYTPRSLTEPIVRTTLRPILERLGPTLAPGEILDLKVCDPAMGSGAFLVEACRQLAEELVKAWHAHDCVPAVPPDEDEILHARRIVAQRCLYGVDKNPMAVDLAKLSLWLATLAKDHPFTFLDHALRCGDSLVGLSRQQIEGFHWKPDKQRDFARGVIEGKIREATKGRLRIQNASEFEPYLKLDQELALVEEALDRPRFYGDLVVSAYFAESNDRQRRDRLDELADTLAAHLANPDFLKLYPALESAVHELRSGEKPVTPFHWEIEFPEVFARENPGFDAIVGNPPFLGGKRTSTAYGDCYFNFLMEQTPQAHGNADLVAFFFRRLYEMLRNQGALGLIATQTIAQGDTRTTGLSYICQRGGRIFAAQRRLAWPGAASVLVSAVHISKDSITDPALLDGKRVPRVTAFLFHRGGDTNPETLQANEGLCFLGFKLYGQGFLFSDDELEGTPLDEMHRLIAENPDNQKVIRPYMGGADLNSSPTQSPHRFVINFGDMTEVEARKWPALMSIVEAKVKPGRMGLKRQALVDRWWQFGEKQPGLVKALAGLERTIVVARVAHWIAFSIVPANQVLNEKIVVFPMHAYHPFAVLSSRVHEVWVRLFSSTLKDDINYAGTDCFDTFPFPAGVLEMARKNEPSLELRLPSEVRERVPHIAERGRAYYEFRANLMVRHNEGLTTTYNRFHDPDERSPDILKLRELHATMDRAVLDAYGWADLKPTCEFLLDYEEDEDEEEATGRRRKKPWRYRWPDDFRDEVLARLLDLNRQRAEEERLSGAAAEAGRGKATKKSTGRRKAATKNPEQPEFFET